MKELEKKIRIRGLGFDKPVFTKQLLRTEQTAIYERKDPNGIMYWEVFKVRKREETTYPNGDYLPEREVYPHYEAFGDWAWCINDKAKALKKYNDLINGEE